MPKRGQKRRPFFQKIRGIKSLRGFFHRHWEWEQWNRKILSSKPGIFGLVDWGSPGYIHVQPGAHSISIEEVSTTLLTLSTCPSSKKKCIYIYILIHTYFILSCIPCTLLWIPQDWKFTTWKEIHGIWHVEFHKSKRHPKKLSPHPKKGPKGWNFWQFGLDFWIGHFQKVSLPGQRRTVFAAGFVLPPFQLRMQICTTRMTIHIF